MANKNRSGSSGKTPTPDRGAGTGNKGAATPNRTAPTPSRTAPTPSRTAPTPSRTAPTPSPTATTPSQAAPTPGAAVNWWDAAYSDIQKWSVNPDQLNKDRGAYRDAFQMNAAEKGLNYDLASRLMSQSTNDEKGMMQLSADLDRRNTLDLMTGEHNFKVAGMRESNTLSKDYLKAEGTENRALQGVVNQGATDVANIKERGETDRTGMSLSSQEKQIGLTGNEQRETLRTQGDEQRRTTAYEREHAAGLATRMSRR